MPAANRTSTQPAGEYDARLGRLKARYYINAQKALVIPATLVIVAAYDAWSAPRVWIYLGLHGTYGLCWLLKDRFFPDHSWERLVPYRWGASVFLILNLYLLVPWLIASGNAGSPQLWFVGLCVALSVMGTF